MAKVKKDESKEGPFRVIMGYDGDALIEPDYKPVVELKVPTTYDEIEYIYIFCEKIPQKYTFLDVMKFVERIMDSGFTEGIWYDFAQQFDYEGEKLWDVNTGEIKKRFKKFGDMGGWLSCMANALQLAFGDRELLVTLGADIGRMKSFLDVNGYETHLLHNCGYQANALRNGFNALHLNETENLPWENHGLVELAYKVIEDIMESDMKILDAIKKTVRKLSQ